MARSTYYYNRKRLGQSDGYDTIRNCIRTIYDKHHGRYGYRRITAQLNNDGININHKTVQKLMGQMSLKAQRKRQHYHSYKGNVGKVAPNIINRDFNTSGPNQKWTTDVTQMRIKDKWVYLSPILDMFNGEIISYTISSRPDLSMVMTMLNKAFQSRDIHGNLIIHSDQGWHYRHKSYKGFLKKKKAIQSMSRKGNCLDNAVIENFWGILKTEWFYLNKFDSIESFLEQLESYIHYFNYERDSSVLCYRTPIEVRYTNMIA